MEKAKEMLIEVIDQQKSGFILDGTKGTASEQQITAPTICFIPNTSTIRNEKGENVKIRYIKDCDTIFVADQEERKIRPSDIKTNDVIAIKKGHERMVREGDIALFDYVEICSWNASSTKRSPKVQPLIRVVEVNTKEEANNEYRFIKADAVKYVSSLVKKVKGGYEYNEAKIDSIANVLNLFGDTPSSKIDAIANYAERKPLDFLQLVTKLDDNIVTHISHAIELMVIRIDGTNVVYNGDSKVVANLGDNLKSAKTGKKIEALSELFKTPEYAEKFNELKARIEIAKEENFKK